MGQSEKRKITVDYLGHSGFLVETQSCLMLFDYFRGDLAILDEKPADKPLICFVSHAHRDHYNPAVFELAGGGRPVHYVLSFDIRGHVPEEYGDGSGCSLTFCDADRTYRIPVPGITVETLLSTDQGVAFFVETGDEVIYHAGDLNWWIWEGDSEEVLDEQETIYKGELARIGDRRIDAAFVVLDDRLKDHGPDGMEYFLSACQADYIFPMHFWEDKAMVSRFVESLAAGPSAADECRINPRIFDTTEEHHWELDLN